MMTAVYLSPHPEEKHVRTHINAGYINNRKNRKNKNMSLKTENFGENRQKLGKFHVLGVLFRMFLSENDNEEKSWNE